MNLDMDTLKDKAAIIGVGETDFSRESGRTETKMAVQAAPAACEGADADPHEIDGLVMFEMDATDNRGLIDSLRIKDADLEKLEIGMPVKVQFETVEEITFPYFVPA